MLVKEHNIIEIDKNFLEPVLSPIVPSWATIANIGLFDLTISEQERVEINNPYIQANESEGGFSAYLEIPIPNDRLNDKYVVLEYSIKPFVTGNYNYAGTGTTPDIRYWMSLNRLNYRLQYVLSSGFDPRYCEDYRVHADSTFNSGSSNYVPNQTTTTLTNIEFTPVQYTLTANRICDTGINVRILYDVNEGKSYILYSTSALPTEIVKSDMNAFGYTGKMNPVSGNTSYMFSFATQLPWNNTTYNSTNYKYNGGLEIDNITIKSYNGETLE